MRSLGTLSLVLGSFIVSGGLLACTGDAGSSSEKVGGDGDGDTSSGSGSTGSSTGDPPAGKAMLRIVHASSDAPAVDIWAKGGDAPLAEGLVYGDASAWLEIDPGTYDVEIKASPSKADDAAAFATGPIEIEEGEKITALAAGLLGSTADASKFRVLPLREDFAPAGSGSAIVRVVHASPDAPSVGIDLHDDDPKSPEMTNLDRFTDTGAAGFPLTAGENLQIGIAASGERVTAFTTPELPEGAELLVIATGLVSRPAREADGFALLAIGPEGTIGFVKQNPIVYALHASPDAPAVDAYAGTARLVSDLSFGNLAGPLQVPPGDYALDFRAAGASESSAPAATAKTGALEAGEQYLSIATGFLSSSGADGFTIDSYASQFALEPASEPRVRVVHGCPDAPMVDVGVLNVEKVVNPVLVNDVSFGNASAPEGLNPGIGTIPLGVTPASDNAAVVASFHVTTAPGLRAFGVAAGSLAGKGQSFRLLVVDTSTAPWSVATVHPQPQQ